MIQTGPQLDNQPDAVDTLDGMDGVVMKEQQAIESTVTVTDVMPIERYTTQSMMVFLQHGQTDGNVQGITKSNDMPLNAEGVAQIRLRAREMVYMLRGMEVPTGTACHEVLSDEQVKLLRNHFKLGFPPHIRRDVETAQVLCEEFGLDFPETDVLSEMYSRDMDVAFLYDAYLLVYAHHLGSPQEFQLEEKYVLEGSDEDIGQHKMRFLELIEVFCPKRATDIYKLAVTHSLQELLAEVALDVELNGMSAFMGLRINQSVDLRKRMMSDYPHLEYATPLSTRKKGRAGTGENFPRYNAKLGTTGAQSGLMTTMETATYLRDKISKIADESRLQGSKVHVFVGHRTGLTALENIKRNSDEYDPLEHGQWTTGSARMAHINRDGEIVQGGNLFTFELDTYQTDMAKLRDVYPYIDRADDLLTNQNIINAYLMALRESSSVEDVELALRAGDDTRRAGPNENPLYWSVVGLLLEKYDATGVDYIVESLVKTLIGGGDVSTSSKLLDMLRTYRDVSDAHATLYESALLDSLWQHGRDVLGPWSDEKYLHEGQVAYRVASDVQSVVDRYEQVNELLADQTVDTLTFGKISFDELYLDQMLTVGSGDRAMKISNSDLLDSSGNQFITAPGGSGKSMLAKYLYTEHLKRGVLPSTITLMHAGVFDLTQVHGAEIVIVDGVDEVSISQQQQWAAFVLENPDVHFVFLGRSFHDSVWQEARTGTSPISLTSDISDLDKTIAHYANLLEGDQRQRYVDFMSSIIPKLGDTDISYTVLDALGLISQSRLSYELLAMETIQRSDVYKFYLKVQAEAGFDKYKRLQTYDLDNDLLDAKLDGLRNAFLLYLAGGETVGHTMYGDDNPVTIQGFYTMEALTFEFMEFLGAQGFGVYDIEGRASRVYNSREPGLIAWLEAKGHAWNSYDDVLHIRYMMFIQTLVITGSLEFKSYNGTEGYAFAHKTVADYFRSKSITPTEYKYSPLYLSIGTKVRMAKNTEHEGVSTMYESLIGPYMDVLLDALFFDGYDGIVDVVLDLSFDLRHDAVISALNTYIANNIDHIVSSLVATMKDKYPDADPSYYRSYDHGVRNFFGHGFGGYGPTMREVACEGLSPSMKLFLSGTDDFVEEYAKNTVVEQLSERASDIFGQLNGRIETNHSRDQLVANYRMAIEEIQRIKATPLGEELGSFYEAMNKSFDMLEDMCFGPITERHVLKRASVGFSGDPIDDIEAAEEIIQKKRDEGDLTFVAYAHG